MNVNCAVANWGLPPLAGKDLGRLADSVANRSDAGQGFDAHDPTRWVSGTGRTLGAARVACGVRSKRAGGALLSDGIPVGLVAF